MSRKNYVILSLILAVCLPAATYCSAAPAPKKMSRSVKNVKSSGNKKTKNTKEEKNTAGENLARNGLEIPWLSTYYIQPQVREDEPVKIGFYVTDWHQSEYRLLDTSRTFDVTLKIRKKPQAKDKKKVKDKVLGKQNLKAGDHEFDAGKFPEGEYLIELSAVDQYGRKSPVLFHEFQVKKDFSIPEKSVYRMKEADLEKYKISNQGDLGIFHFFDASGLESTEDVQIMLIKASEKMEVPPGRYMVIAGAEKHNPEKMKNHRGARGVPEPEWLPVHWSHSSCMVIYADDYNKGKVEADSVLTGKGLNQFLADVREKGFKKIILLPGTYRISNQTPVTVPAGITLDLNGATVKLNQFTGDSAAQIIIPDGYDTHVVNGIVEGDYFEHDYKNSEHKAEWVCGIKMEGEAKYSSFENILVRYIAGYGVTHGFKGHYGKHLPVKGFEKGTIDEKTGKRLPDVKGLAVSQPVSVLNHLNDGGYLAVSRFLGYQGMVGTDWSLRFHFYDAKGKYLETVYGRQYRRVRIPEKAETVRVTVYAKEPPQDDQLNMNLFRVPWNSWYKDLYILSARCVGMAPAAMYNFRVENCTFVRSGESLAKCAFDAEDGWDMMQDVWYVRNKFFKNRFNDFLTCGGHNFIIEDNEGRIHLWNRTNGYVIRNNSFRDAFFGAGNTRARTGLIRISGNTYTDSVQLGDRNKNAMSSMSTNNIQNIGTAAQDALAAVDPSQWETAEEKTAEQADPAPWFVNMLDAASAPNVECGKNGVIVGAKFTGKIKITGMLNLLKCTIEGNRDLRLEGSRLVQCKLKDFEAFLDNVLVPISDSVLENGTLNLSENGAIVIRNSTLKNFSVYIGYRIFPLRMVFENCTIENTDKPLVSTGACSIGNFSFVNCRINTGTSAPVVVYNLHRNDNRYGDGYEKQTGIIGFENCTVESQKNSVVSIEENDKPKNREKYRGQKKIVLKDKNNRYPQNFIQSKPEWWDVQK